MTRRKPQTQFQAPALCPMIRLFKRRNARHVGAQKTLFGCMAMDNARIVTQMLCRAVMGLCANSRHSFLLKCQGARI